MKTRNTMAALALCGATALATSAFAGEIEYGGTFCSHSKTTMLQANPDVTAFNLESWGIQTPDSAFKPWANATNHCAGNMIVVQGKVSGARRVPVDGRRRRHLHRDVRRRAGQARWRLDVPRRHRKMEGRDRRRNVPIRQFKQTAARRNRRGLRLA